MGAKKKSKHPNLREELHTTAVFMPKTDDKGKKISSALQKERQIKVHFNPESLDITFTNTVQKGRRNQPAQATVTETTAKLSMELIFDTTLKGVDVRTETIKIARLMDPAQKTPRKKNAKKKKIPSIVIFQWGTIWFEGYIDSYKEKIDFFSSEGVSLRATVSISMTQQQRSFDPNEKAPYDKGSTTKGKIALQSNAPIERIGQNNSMSDMAQKHGNPLAARYVAAQNGIENLRHPEVNEIVIMDSSLPQTPRFDFAMKQGEDDLGPASSENTARMFSRLRNQFSASAHLSMGTKLSLDVGSQLSESIGVGANTTFGIGGEVDVDTGASLSADVGVDADIELGIQFEE